MPTRVSGLWSRVSKDLDRRISKAPQGADGISGRDRCRDGAPPATSPNLNAFAERFVRRIKESCFNRLILFGEGSRRRAVREFDAHYHHERNHQGLGNVLIFPTAIPMQSSDRVVCRERLGGLLKFYHRPAA